MARLAEREAETIRERISAGCQAARARARKGSRPPMDKNKIDMAITLYDYEKDELGWNLFHHNVTTFVLKSCAFFNDINLAT